MKIGIIGGGSIGLLFAFYLSEHYDVTIYTRTWEQSDALHRNGLHLICNGRTKQRSIQSELFEKWTGLEELTIIAVKQYHLPYIVSEILDKQSKNTDFIFLQNGMGHLKLLKLLEAKSIYVSSVDHGAYKKNLFSVEHNGFGQAKIALFKGEFGLPQSIFSIPNFPFIFEANFYEMLLKKLVANAVINPLTALLKVENGKIVENENFLQSAKSLYAEISDILNLEHSQYFQQVMDICRKTSRNRSSMLKDIEAKRPTEIDAIIGYILEEAEKKGINAPICQTLYHFIKGSEN